MTDEQYDMLVFIKSARVGYSQLLLTLTAYHMAYDPCSQMTVQPTQDDLENYSKLMLSPMLRDTPCLQGLIDDKSRTSSNTITNKSYPGGFWSGVGAHSPRGFRMKTIRILAFDEVDGYPASAGEEGDQISLGIKRTETVHNRKIILGSTPTDKDTSRVHKWFMRSDQRYYYVPCPYCNEMQILKFENLKVKESPAYFECTHCEEAIHHTNLNWMNARGEWRKHNPSSKIAGFHIWAAYSPMPNATWQHIADEFLKVKDDPLELKTFVNTWLGEVWETESKQINSDSFMLRLEEYKDEVPSEVACIVAGLDVQDDRIECSVVGYTPTLESYGISHVVFSGQIANNAVWAELDKYLNKPFRHESGVDIYISAACIDTGGHFTEAVYDYGKVNPKVFLIKGSSTVNAKIIETRTQKKGRGTLYTIGTNAAKEQLMFQLSVDSPGPHYCHFNNKGSFDDEYFKQLTAEKMTIKKTRGRVSKVFELKKQGLRNEALDCRVYALAAIYLVKQQHDLDNMRRCIIEAARGVGSRQSQVKTKRQKKTINKGLGKDDL